MKIYGPVISTYVRIVTMTAEEAGVAYSIVPTAANAEEQRVRHPFLKAPAVEIDDQSMFETAAICQYIDDRFANCLHAIECDRASSNEYGLVGC